MKGAFGNEGALRCFDYENSGVRTHYAVLARTGPIRTGQPPHDVGAGLHLTLGSGQGKQRPAESEGFNRLVLRQLSPGALQECRVNRAGTGTHGQQDNVRSLPRTGETDESRAVLEY